MNLKLLFSWSLLCASPILFSSDSNAYKGDEGCPTNPWGSLSVEDAPVGNVATGNVTTVGNATAGSVSNPSRGLNLKTNLFMESFFSSMINAGLLLSFG